MAWLENANYVKEVCGAFINYEEEYYICPECGEPVLAEDWDDNEMENYLCPICELTQNDLE